MYAKLALPGNLSLYDSELQEISYYKENHIIYAKALIKLSYPHNTFIELLFEDVQECSFFWNIDYDFYIIESYKLLQADGIYYISFDPVNEDSTVSEKDNDIIKCKRISGYYLSNTP